MMPNSIPCAVLRYSCGTKWPEVQAVSIVEVYSVFVGLVTQLCSTSPYYLILVLALMD